MWKASTYGGAGRPPTTDGVQQAGAPSDKQARSTASMDGALAPGGAGAHGAGAMDVDQDSLYEPHLSYPYVITYPALYGMRRARDVPPPAPKVLSPF